jgi:hypothetical protein
MGVPPSTGRATQRTNHLINFYFVVRRVAPATCFIALFGLATRITPNGMPGNRLWWPSSMQSSRR